MRLIFIILLITCNLLAQTPPVTNTQLPVSVQSGLVGYWSLNEAVWNGTHSEVKNHIASGGDGYRINYASATTSGKFGNGGDFTGNASMAVIVPTTTAYNFGTSEFSISCWYKPTKSMVGQACGIVNLYHQPFTWGWYIDTDDTFVFRGYSITGVARFAVKYSGIVALLTLNSWHHLVATRDTGLAGKYARLYVDGVELSTTAYEVPTDGAVFWNSCPIYIGNISSMWSIYHALGIIDEVAIWNRELSLNEIKAIYRSGVGGMIIQ